MLFKVNKIYTNRFTSVSSPAIQQSFSADTSSSTRPKHVSISYLKILLTGATAAIEYLCNEKIVHNDIKGDNILIEYLSPSYKVC